jgi:type III secretion system ATPase
LSAAALSVRVPCLPAVCRGAHPVRVRGAVLEAPLADVRIGELCRIRAGLDDRTVLGCAQVIGLGREVAVLALLGTGLGLSRSVVLEPTGERLALDVSADLLGKVVDAAGQVRLELAEPADLRGLPRERREVDAPAPDYVLRRPVQAPFETGVRLIDGVLACGIGQRVAVLAPAGSGKTSLLLMIAAHAAADVRRPEAPRGVVGSTSA